MNFPDTKKERIKDLWRWTFLIYGREKIGKSILASTFPDVVFIPTEPGLKSIECRMLCEENGFINNWTDFLKAIKLVEDNKDKCKCVCIDTADRAYDLCVEYVCKSRGIEALGLDKQGRKDYGASWSICNQEFLRAIHRLICVGKGVIFTSHAKIYSEDKIQFVTPTMSNKCRAVIEPLVDNAFFAEHVLRNVKGKGIIPDRILLCLGNVYIWAGGRYKFPKFLPLLEENGYSIIEKAFNDPTYQGIPESEIIKSVEKNEPLENMLK